MSSRKRFHSIGTYVEFMELRPAIGLGADSCKADHGALASTPQLQATCLLDGVR